MSLKAKMRLWLCTCLVVIGSASLTDGLLGLHGKLSLPVDGVLIAINMIMLARSSWRLRCLNRELQVMYANLGTPSPLGPLGPSGAGTRFYLTGGVGSGSAIAGSSLAPLPPGELPTAPGPLEAWRSWQLVLAAPLLGIAVPGEAIGAAGVGRAWTRLMRGPRDPFPGLPALLPGDWDEVERVLETIERTGRVALRVREDPQEEFPQAYWFRQPLRFALCSLAQPELWTPGEPLAASCLYDLHEAPDAGCSCGIYAYAERDHALREATEVFGSVSLWGHVVEHSFGYRAQFGYPKSLLLAPGAGTRLCAHLTAAYRVPAETADWNGYPPGGWQ